MAQHPVRGPAKPTRREWLALALLCLIIFLTRLPWLSEGHGSAPDAYRVVNAARQIAETGEYLASRPPGFPLFEFLVAFTPAKTSPFFANSLSAVASCIASLFFALILRYFGIRQYLLIALVFALVPLVYVRSTMTVDQMFALAAMLGSTYFTLAGRYLLGGLALGVAIGFRITSGAMLLPLVVWILLEHRPVSTAIKPVLVLIVTGLGVGLLCFLPVIQVYGIWLYAFDGFNPPASSVVTIATEAVWGRVGIIGLCLLALYAFFLIRAKSLPANPNVRNGLIISLLVIGLYTVAFLIVPHNPKYLLPTIPFLLLSVSLLGQSTSTSLRVKSLFWVGLVCLVIASFVTVNRSGMALNGHVLSDHAVRESRTEEVERAADTIEGLPGKSVVVASYKLPQLVTELDDRAREWVDGDESRGSAGYRQYIEHRRGSHEYIYLIKSEDADRYRQSVEEGWMIYFLPGVDKDNLYFYGVDLAQLGAQPLDLNLAQ